MKILPMNNYNYQVQSQNSKIKKANNYQTGFGQSKAGMLKILIERVNTGEFKFAETLHGAIKFEGDSDIHYLQYFPNNGNGKEVISYSCFGHNGDNIYPEEGEGYFYQLVEALKDSELTGYKQ